MIEISFGKLLLLALIALIVLGPEKLPGAARTAGALIRRLRSGWDSVRTEVERELEIEEIRRAAREAAAQAEAAQNHVRDAVKQVDHAARDVGANVKREVGDIADQVKSSPAEGNAAAVGQDAASAPLSGTLDALATPLPGGVTSHDALMRPKPAEPEPVANHDQAVLDETRPSQELPRGDR